MNPTQTHPLEVSNGVTLKIRKLAYTKHSRLMTMAELREGDIASGVRYSLLVARACIDSATDKNGEEFKLDRERMKPFDSVLTEDALDTLPLEEADFKKIVDMAAPDGSATATEGKS